MSSSSVVWLNGDLVPAEEARIDPSDHGLLTGDGVFETLIVYGGKAFAFTRHWERPEDWINCLSEKRQEQLQDLIAAAKARDGFVGEIAYTQFSDKKTLIVKGGFLSRSKTKAIESLRKIFSYHDLLIF